MEQITLASENMNYELALELKQDLEYIKSNTRKTKSRNK